MKIIQSKNWNYNGQSWFFDEPNPHFQINEYNQNDERLDYNYCTIFASMNTILTNTWYKFTQNDIVQACKQARQEWVVQPNWATAPDAMRFVEKYVNKNFNLNIVAFRFDIYKDEVYEEFLKALNNWRAFSQFYKSSSESYEDINDDWIAKKKDYEKWEIWHMTNLVMLDWEIKSVNNYKWERKYNIFTWKYFKKLLENHFMYPVAYTFLDASQIWMRDINKIVIHHTAINSDVDKERSLEIINDSAYEKLHKYKNSLWYYIAYHYVVFSDWSVEKTRPEDEVWYHAWDLSVNKESIGIALNWNFENEKPTDEQLQKVSNLIENIKDKYWDIWVVPHRNIKSTACPWNNMSINLLNLNKNNMTVEEKNINAIKKFNSAMWNNIDDEWLKNFLSQTNEYIRNNLE